MSALKLRLSNSLHIHVKEAAELDGVSVNQFINLAVAEKLATLRTYDLVSKRKERGNKALFIKAMSEVPKGDVVAGDELV